jgi:lipoprotein-anchoring transpeptidase ErfK/SrfK
MSVDVLRRSLAVVAVAAAVGLTGCGGGAASSGPRPPVSPSPAAGASTAPARADPVVVWPQRAFAVTAADLIVHRSPASSAGVVARLPAWTAFGSQRVVLALARRAGWLQVALPTRPNGTTGWVAAGDVRLEPVTRRILIDLRTRTLRVLAGKVVLAQSPVAVGTRANPTPRGTFYVTDRVHPDDPHGRYGSFALGLSAHSPTLTEFDGSDGQVAIHGTNDPASIGRAVSHGCIRVPDKVAAVLSRIPLGTPVTVR